MSSTINPLLVVQIMDDFVLQEDRNTEDKSENANVPQDIIDKLHKEQMEKLDLMLKLNE